MMIQHFVKTFSQYKVFVRNLPFLYRFSLTPTPFLRRQILIGNSKVICWRSLNEQVGGCLLNRQNLLNVTNVVCQWSLKGHFGQWIDTHWICRSRISLGIYTVNRWVGEIIGNASCVRSRGIRVWQCGEVARLT